MDNQNNQNRNNQDPNRNNRQGISFVVLVTLITTILVLALFQFQGTGTEEEITYDKFLKMVDDGKVAEVQIQNDRLLIKAKKQDGERVAKEYYTGVVQDDTLSDRLYKANVKYSQEIPDTTSAVVLNVLLTFLPIALIVGTFVWMTRKMSKGGGVMGVGKSNAKMYVEKQTGVTFQDVAGQDEAKESLPGSGGFPPQSGEIYQRSAPSCPREPCWWALREPVRRCLPRRWQERQRCRSFPVRFGFCGDVCGRGRVPCPGSVQAGPADGALYHFHR